MVSIYIIKYPNTQRKSIINKDVGYFKDDLFIEYNSRVTQMESEIMVETEFKAMKLI